MSFSDGAYCLRCKLKVDDLRRRDVADLLVTTRHQINFGGDMSVLLCGRDGDDRLAEAIRDVQLAKSAANEPVWMVPL